MTNALNWVHRAADIGARGLTGTRTASSEERLELARMLDIVSCEAMQAHYEIKPLSGERFRFAGTLTADVTQACVVTLEPVIEHIAEEFAIELRPRADLDAEAPGSEQEALSAPDVEPMDDGVIDAGALLFEVLSAALEPYPRKEGAEFDWVDPKLAEDPAAASPFAALAKLKSTAKPDPEA